MAKRVTLSIRQSTAQALIAQRLGHGERQVGGAPAQHGGHVRGRDHDHAAGAGRRGPSPWWSKRVDLAAALADQPEHQGIGIAVAGQHREQRRLADAGAGEDPHALARDSRA